MGCHGSERGRRRPLRVSVIVCARNGRPYLDVQLAALVAQDAPVPFEVVVVDNGSTDGTREDLRSWQARHDTIGW